MRIDTLNKKLNKKTTGFTLVEILITIIIVGILASFALPSFRVALEKTTAAQVVEM